MMRTAYIAVKDRDRLAEILRIVMGLGMHGLIKRLGLASLVQALPGVKATSALKTMSEPARFRKALEELGPTFIKLGQLLSCRPDMLPPEWIAELEQLQTAAQPLPWSDVQPMVEEELGCPVEEAFAQFDRQAFAAASIAQVHRAQLHTGEEVVVKIRRPHTEEKIRADMRILAHVVDVAEKEWPDLARYRPADMLRHLATALLDEVNLTHEGENTVRVRENLDGIEGVVIPRIEERFMSNGILVQEFISGTAPTDPAALRAQGFDTKLLAARGAQAFMHMVLADGFFHADPHAGNLLALPDNRVAFLDFGMVGIVSARRRGQLLEFVEALLQHDSARFTTMLLEWSGNTSAVDLQSLEADAENFIGALAQSTPNLTRILHGAMALARQHGLILPADLALLFKALITAEGLLRRLDPDFDLIAAAAPLMKAQIKQHYSLGALRRKTAAFGRDMGQLMTELPALARILSRRIKQGDMEARLHITNLEPLANAIERAGTRVSIGLVIAAFALGLAPYLLRYSPEVWGITVFVGMGFAVVCGGLFWLLAGSRK